MQRLQGWRLELARAGRHDPKLEWLNPAPSSLALGGQMFEQIIGQTPPIDAIFFCDDDLAQGALLAAARQHIEVPRQVAIAGFNDLTGSDQMIPPLTTVHTPRSEISAEAAAMLLKLMRGERCNRRRSTLDIRSRCVRAPEHRFRDRPWERSLRDPTAEATPPQPSPRRDRTATGSADFAACVPCARRPAPGQAARARIATRPRSGSDE